MNKVDSLIAPQTKEFVRLCRKYFEYLEKMPDKKISDFWLMQLRLLPDIYTGLFRLPQIDARYSPEVEKFVTESEYNKTFINLVAFIGALDRFSDFGDLSHPGAVKVVEASLSEILTDIYQELKDFVLLYETGTLENMNDAIVDCLDSFGRYWGVKLLSATRIIHVNLYQQRYAEAKKSSHLDDEFEEDLAEGSDYDDGLD
jgi:hypothetical protein